MKSKLGWGARKLDGRQNQLAIGSKNRSYSQPATGLVAGQAESAGVMISRAHLSGCILPANSCPNGCVDQARAIIPEDEKGDQSKEPVSSTARRRNAKHDAGEMIFRLPIAWFILAGPVGGATI